MNRFRFTILTASLLFSQSIFANYSAGYSAGIASGMAMSSSSSDSNDVFISRNFDYVVACHLRSKKISYDNYRYFCPEPPKKDIVLFMATVFRSDHWPSKFIYYMKIKNDN